jgi:hypothetical protein
MNSKDLLNAISKELEFYRKRQLSIHYFSLLSQVLVITGEQHITVKNQVIANRAYILFFIGIFIFNLGFSKSYAERIHTLRDKRAELIINEKLINPFPKHREFKTPSPNWLYILTITSLSAVGVVLIIVS